MDIQKEREVFEKLPDINAILHNSEFGFNEGINQYYHPNHAEHRLSYAFLMGAWLAWQAKAQAVPRWISVKDKLPGFNQSVLSCDGFETCVAEYLESCKNEYGVFFEEGFWINGAASIFENVTHWMPLPEAIEAQEQTHD